MKSANRTRCEVCIIVCAIVRNIICVKLCLHIIICDMILCMQCARDNHFILLHMCIPEPASAGSERAKERRALRGGEQDKQFDSIQLCGARFSYVARRFFLSLSPNQNSIAHELKSHICIYGTVVRYCIIVER